MAKTCDEMLMQLNKDMLEMAQEGGRGQNELIKLWRALTALRGPDNEEEKDKMAVTTVIRRHVFDMFVLESVGVNREVDTEASLALRQTKNWHNFDHFWSHARMAFEALGLHWEKVNQQTTAGMIPALKVEITGIVVDEAATLPKL